MAVTRFRPKPEVSPARTGVTKHLRCATPLWAARRRRGADVGANRVRCFLTVDHFRRQAFDHRLKAHRPSNVVWAAVSAAPGVTPFIAFAAVAGFNRRS